MTDISSVKAHADPQPASVALCGGPPPPAFSNGSPALDGTIDEEESSTIKCICGFPDDDGNTVLCEKCDTWQHIVCYYESPLHVPDVHECAECFPRPVDAKGASDKQRLRRELHNIGERRGKPKTATKNHKKRVKDPLASVQPNGWAVHSNNDLFYNTDQKSGSPRDQPPPSKRPKTSHRASGSINIISQPPALIPGSRKRASSTMFNGHSPVKSPTNPDSTYMDGFSPEFLNLYRQPEPPSAESNSYTDIRVANDISLWLNDRDALAEATGGMEPGQVFQRIDQTIENLEQMAPVITKQTEEGHNAPANGLQPQWQYLTVETFVPKDGIIGELKGRIGRKEDYFSDPSNRWDLLRHPEPFVFFPPHLPVYIDMRHEGNILRYTRRSCNPNVGMRILTQGPESGYHFCFVAVDDIHPGDELTVGWQIDPDIQKQLLAAVNNGDIRKEGFKKIEPWIACVLANFGGCACDTRGRECLLERARCPNPEPARPVKATSKAKKKRNAQISPLSTGHATNSRAGSEAFNRDVPDEENVDSRSASSSHSKPSSRDITPATHFSLDGGDLKMSDRERRKLQQQERLFEQLEYDEQHKGKRGKRNSAGSTLNTPSLSSSKQLGHSEPSPSARHPREHSNGVARKTSGNSTKTSGHTVSKPKPVYVDSSTQTKIDPPNSTITPSVSSLVKKKEVRPIMSFKRKLLQQAQEDRLQRERIRSASVKMEARSPVLKDVESSKPSPAPQSVPTEESSVTDISGDSTAQTVIKEPTPTPLPDVEMRDLDETAATKPASPKIEEMPDAPNSDPPMEAAQPSIQPPPPPWTSSPITTTSNMVSEQPTTTMAATEPVNLQLQLPSSDLTNHSTSIISVVTPGPATSVTGNAIAQSPISTNPASLPFSPSVTNAVTPGPTRKKFSLSEYTSRRAKLAQTQSSSIGASPLFTTSQPTGSPTMTNSNLPNQTSPSAMTTESGSLVSVTEEQKQLQSST